jgi:hypothetical protein
VTGLNWGQAVRERRARIRGNHPVSGRFATVGKELARETVRVHMQRASGAPRPVFEWRKREVPGFDGASERARQQLGTNLARRDCFVHGHRERVIRGGSWFNEQEALPGANRHRRAPESRQTNLGLRLVSSER